MGTRKRDGLPTQLEGVRRRFERWRQTRPVRSRIPDSLWRLAVKMARIHGIHQTSKTLRVNYYALKRRLEEQSPPSLAGPGNGVGAAFVELVPPASIGLGECVLQWEDAGGAKMRVHLKGVAAPDLIGLSRSFWEG